MTEDTDRSTPDESIADQVKRFASRRDVLKTGAAASVAGLGLTAGAGSAAASGDGDAEDEGTMTETQTQTDTAGDIDAVAVLNYALVLERLEATFYTRGLEEFSEEEIESSDLAAQLGDQAQGSVYDRLTTIRDHERSHVDKLVTTINNLGGSPVSEDQVEFTFEFTNPETFVKTAQTFETVGVSAYDGAIDLLSGKDKLLTAAARIATVEGRHSAYLNDLVGKSPFPRAFDDAKPPSEILELVNPFVATDLSEVLEIA